MRLCLCSGSIYETPHARTLTAWLLNARNEVSRKKTKTKKPPQLRRLIHSASSEQSLKFSSRCPKEASSSQVPPSQPLPRYLRLPGPAAGAVRGRVVLKRWAPGGGCSPASGPRRCTAPACHGCFLPADNEASKACKLSLPGSSCCYPASFQHRSISYALRMSKVKRKKKKAKP